ncbi:MAG TPA: type II secretion system protein [Kiritimatiellia bacterium]|nr:type II secretion system protein [Kiritimatiellia bacterium]HRU20079.1 type II secretion system protein [Kiritimatiellia bacterium]
MGRTDQSGMTVVELMVAMGLLVIILTAVFPLVDQMISRFQMARDHYVAASLSQGRIERARGVPYSDLHLYRELGTRVDDFGNAADPAGRFLRKTEVTVNSPTTNMTHMTVTTYPCTCSRWGWRKVFHPIKTGKFICRFDELDFERMDYLFTEELKRAP